MEVVGSTTGNTLYADPTLITNASKLLTTAKAGIRLKAGSTTRSVAHPETGDANMLPIPGF
ncbi:hypothetical protein [Chitinophaga sp. YR627]|uniref:hypothetical protein n=1 Tax=Chitinophaga sp. YR627 TaxID=1881041 RepID=UPI001160BB68|nr:hypothetical protein [Chitinophaga sp. YR627]